MTLACLTPEEREVVRRTIAATFHYFDVDFQTRLGVSAEQVRRLLAAWPAVDDADDGSIPALAINNALNDLLNGEGIREAEAVQLTGVGRAELQRVYEKWRQARGWSSTGIR